MLALFCGICGIAFAGVASNLGSLWLASRARSYEPERQNLSPEEGGFTLADYEGFMRIIDSDSMLDRRGNAATLAEFSRLGAPPASILEVGPGSGGFARVLARAFPNSTVLGIDANELSINSARAMGESLPNLRFEHRSSAELDEPPQSYDVITTTYVNHEIFPDSSFVEFLRRVRVVGRKAFIFNDYFRSFGCLVPAALGFNMGEHMHTLVGLQDWVPIAREARAELEARQAVLLSQTRSAVKLATDAGLQSMKRAFTLEEYRVLFRQAGYPRSALRCTRHDGWGLADFFGPTCRVTCFVDLAGGTS